MIRRQSKIRAVIFAAVWVAGRGVAGAQTGTPTYTADIEPILRRHCVACHRAGDIAPFSLDSYDEARVRGRAIADATARGYMPPWKPATGVGGPFAGARGLTTDEIATIGRWVAAGMPRGGEGAAAATPA